MVFSCGGGCRIASRSAWTAGQTASRGRPPCAPPPQEAPCDCCRTKGTAPGPSDDITRPGPGVAALGQSAQRPPTGDARCSWAANTRPLVLCGGVSVQVRPF